MRRSVLIGAAAGVLVIGGLVIFGPGALTASGLEPDLCATCHIMEGKVHSFKGSESAHRTETTCSDCHLPHGGMEGLKEKYRTGFRHVAAMVKGDLPEDLRLNQQARQMVLDNCNRCHAQEEHTRLNGTNSCLNCHSNDPHGERGM